MRRLVFIISLCVCFALSANGAGAENIARGVRVIVIDAGHGGPKFPGAHYRGIYEKDLNLKVALKLGALIERELPEVKVVYTRKTDKQFSESLTKDLQARADIANKAEGDLFFSIHTNAAPTAAARGVETLIMGESPLEQRINDEVLFANNKEEFIDMSDQRTAAIVRAYISNLRFTYGEYSEAMARLLEKNYKQAGRYVRKTKPQLLKVLYATNMPGVLTEIGFMSNPEELRYMCSEKGQNEIARSLFNAVKDYVNFVRGMQLVEECDDATTQAPVEPAPVVSEPAPQPAKAAAAKKPSSGYTIQILASTKRLKSNDWQFKSYKNKVIELRSAGRYRYKYCVGRYATQAEAKRALSQVKKKLRRRLHRALRRRCDRPINIPNYETRGKDRRVRRRHAGLPVGRHPLSERHRYFQPQHSLLCGLSGDQRDPDRHARHHSGREGRDGHRDGLRILR